MRKITVIVAVTLLLPALVSAHSSADAINAAAGDFIASLEPEQRDRVLLPMNTDERAVWSNLPIIMIDPPGLLIRELNDEQKRAAHALMRATLSSQGYAKIAGIMILDDLLFAIETAALDRDPENGDDPVRREMTATRNVGHYAIAIHGRPGGDAWGWKIAGHHAAANFTIADGHVAFTPTFLGSSPAEVESGRYAGFMALAKEAQLGLDLLNSLSDRQRRKAVIADRAVADVLAGPGRRESLQSFEGIRATELDDAQQHRLRLLISEYLHNAGHDAAARQWSAIEAAGIDKLWFAWMGPSDADGLFYYRVHGPRILIEYNRQNKNHDHMIVRDPANDYGEDWLGRHYEEHHPTFDEALKRGLRRAEERTR